MNCKQNFSSEECADFTDATSLCLAQTQQVRYPAQICTTRTDAPHDESSWIHHQRPRCPFRSASAFQFDATSGQPLKLARCDYKYPGKRVAMLQRTSKNWKNLNRNNLQLKDLKVTDKSTFSKNISSTRFRLKIELVRVPFISEFHWREIPCCIGTTAKMIDELLPNMIKAINILQGHKVSTKKTKSANTSAKPPKYYAQSKNATWTIAGEEWSFQKTVGIQADYEGTKNANESSKATKYCAQQQKWYMNYCRIWYKSSKYCRDTR